MPNHSQSWQNLKSILTGYASVDRLSEHHSFEDHARAQALAIFLSHARLATPKLDRRTVEMLLAGEQTWPHADGPRHFEKIDLAVSFLEDHGLIAFYADWCRVCCRQTLTEEKVDPSLIPIVQAIERIRDIRDGRDGYVRPHFACPVDELEKQLANTFGTEAIEKLLPELERVEGEFNLPPGNSNFSPLISTCLWHTLRKELDIKQAFDRWMLCQRVNCGWAMPAYFDVREYEERKEFDQQLLDHLAQDASLGIGINVLLRQLINTERFTSIISPKMISHIRKDSAGGEPSSHTEVEELPKPAADTLSSAYPAFATEGLSDLQLVELLTKYRDPCGLELFYPWLVFSSIDGSIHVSSHTLASSGFTESLIELATSRPVLKYMLFNESPFHERASFYLLLLSRSESCDIALHHLSLRSACRWHSDNDLPAEHFDKGYQLLVRDEYLRTIDTDPKRGARIVIAAELLGERCSLQAVDFARSFEYQFLENFLDGLGHQQVIDFGGAFASHLSATVDETASHRSTHHRYLVGFWLLERMENAGIDSSGAVSGALRTGLLSYYTRELTDTLQGAKRGLEPTFFFSTLPWHRLSTNGAGPILTMSTNTGSWLQHISYSEQHSSTSSSAVGHYLQVLMYVGHPKRMPDDWMRVARRIAEIVQKFGFGSRDHAIFLFDVFFYRNQYDLWGQFCSYANGFQDDLYEDFLDRCVPNIPLDQLFVLLERTTVVARTQKLQDVIAYRQSNDVQDLGLAGLEKAFVSACDAGHTVLATKIVAAARDIVSQERFANSNEPHAVRFRKIWLSYEYKWDLMVLFETLKDDPKKFEKEATQKPIPHDQAHLHSVNRAHWQDCEHFRRYIIAAAYRDTDPEKCVRIMESLYKQTNDRNHSFLLFTGRVAIHPTYEVVNGLRNALSQFLLSLGAMAPSEMPAAYVAAILDVYRKLDDASGIDAFWSKLSADQKNRVQILHPYCRALIARGQASVAKQIIGVYRELNHKTQEGLGLDDLIEELGKASSSELTMRDLAQMMSDNGQRSSAQLATYYDQIVGKTFEEYVAIVGQGRTPTEFLRDVVLEIASELLLRKKNLQDHSGATRSGSNMKITGEDLINDWFTSLFDKRMAEARVGFRDQKRGGQSASGFGPGEIDGFITDGMNRRVAIFEAFRLFSKDTTVISTHLNKIASYDNECLSPVFIAAYCDVADFGMLTDGYREFVSNEVYSGYEAVPAGRPVNVMRSTDHLWVGLESRRRGALEVTFCHLLLNLRS